MSRQLISFYINKENIAFSDVALPTSMVTVKKRAKTSVSDELGIPSDALAKDDAVVPPANIALANDIGPDRLADEDMVATAGPQPSKGPIMTIVPGKPVHPTSIKHPSSTMFHELQGSPILARMEEEGKKKEKEMEMRMMAKLTEMQLQGEEAERVQKEELRNAAEKVEKQRKQDQSGWGEI
ncbi:hypothetical protein BD779DRAFT_1480171 [Infundibulicybe gibba]|nr:hypothetical protein BD779DRAFT_1480171 [Infundibulicybe gibba]